MRRGRPSRASAPRSRSRRSARGRSPSSALVPLLLVLRSRSAGRGALVGLCFGLGLFGASLYWIALFGSARVDGARPPLGRGDRGCSGRVAVIVRRPDRPIVDALAIAAAWTVRRLDPRGVAVRRVHLGLARRLPGGEPDPAAAWPGSPASGAITFVVVLVNAALAALLTREGRGARRVVPRDRARRSRSWRPCCCRPPSSTGRPCTIAVGADRRPGAGRASRRCEEDLLVARRNIEAHRTPREPTRAPDLVVWGEGALDPAALAGSRDRGAATQAAIAAVGVPTTVGAVVNDPDGIAAHERAGLRRTRRAGGPLRQGAPRPVRGVRAVSAPSLTWIERDRPDPGRPGAGGAASTRSRSRACPPYGTPICFENAFPSIPRTFVRDGATLPRRAGQQRLLPVHGGRRAAPADESDARGRDRSVGRGRRRLGYQRVHRPRRGGAEPAPACSSPLSCGARSRPSTAQTLYVRFGDWLPVLSYGDARDVRPDSAPTHAGATRCPGRCRRRCGRSRSCPPTTSATRSTAAIRGVLATPGRRRPRRRRFLARRHGRHRPGDRRWASPGSVCWRDRPNRGSPAPTSKGSRSRSPRATTWRSRWTPTFPTTPPSSRASWGPPRDLDLVVGSRYVPGGSVTDWSRRRVALSRAGNVYARLMLGLPIHDATSGYRVYRRAAARSADAPPVRRGRLRIPGRARPAEPSARVRRRRGRRSRSATARSANRRSPTRSCSRRCGRSPAGASTCGSVRRHASKDLQIPILGQRP